jgi:hypothetical protein
VYGSYEHRERRRVRYLWPGHLVEEVLHERLSGSAEAVASDREQTSDVHDRLVVDETTESTRASSPAPRVPSPTR